MKIPDVIQATRDTLKHLALAAALGIGLGAGSALAATETATYDLGPQDAGTTILPGTVGLLPWIAKGTLPPGSILRSVSINARLDSMAAGGDSWASDLSAYVDPTPEAAGTAALLQVGGYSTIGTVATKLSWGNGDAGPGTTVVGTKTAGIDFPNTIDLSTAELSLGNGYSEGTWSGTISVEYDAFIPASILSFGPGAVIDQDLKTIAWTVPFGANLTTLTPTLTLSSGDCVPASGESPVLDGSNQATYTVTDAVAPATNVYTLTVTVGPDETALIWNGASGTWDLSTTNWLGQTSGSPMAFFNGAAVLFDNAAGGTVTITPDMAPASTTVSAGNYTFSGGPLAGSGSLTKDGSGTLKIDGLVPGTGTVVQNTYSGGTIMNSGTLHLGGMFAGISPDCRGALGTGTVTLNGGTIEFDRYTETNALIANGGTLYSQNGWGATWSGPITLNADLTMRAGYGLTGSGEIDGTGGLIKTGNETLTLRGPGSTYTGKTIVTAGTLRFAGAAYLSDAGLPGVFGAPTGPAATIDLHNGTTLRCDGSNPRVNQSTNRPLNLASDGDGTVSIRYNDNDASLTFGDVTATGTGAKTLALFTGNNGNGDREAVIFTGAIADSSDSPTSLAITFNTQGSPNWVSLSGVNTFTGPITLAQTNGTANGVLVIGGVRVAQSGNNTVGTGTLGNGDYPGAISLGARTVLEYDSTTPQILAGAISGPGALQVTGSGELTLTNANTYSGNTTVDAGCKLRLTQKVALGTETSVYLSDTAELNLDFAAPDMVQVAKLFVNGSEQPKGLYKASDSTESGDVLAQLTGTGRLLVGIPLVAGVTAAPGTTGDAPFEVTFTDSSVSILGTVNSWSWDFGDGTTSTDQNPGLHTYALWGSYPVTLTVGDTEGYSATTTETITVTQPLDLIVSSAGQFATAIVNVDLDPANTVTFNTGVVNPGFGGLTGNGTFALEDQSAACINLEVGGSGPDTKFSGALTGCGSLTKVGTNKFSLSGTDNTYTGDTVVNNGVLELLGEVFTPGLVAEFYSGNNTGNMSTLEAFEAWCAGHTLYLSTTTVAYQGGDGHNPAHARLWYPDAGGHFYDMGFNTAVLPGVDVNNNYSVRMTGMIKIVEAGTYDFIANSDDGSMLWIDGVLVVSNDFAQGMADNNNPSAMNAGRHGTIELTTGYHDIVIGMNEGGGGHGLNVSYMGPDTVSDDGSPTGANPQYPTQGNVNGWVYIPNSVLGVFTPGGNDILPTGTTLRIVSPGILNITSGTHAVNMLYLDGAPQAVGTWGSTESTADNKNDAYFSGTGVLVVSNAGGSGFDSWAGANGVTGGVDGDSNNDGVQNGIAYFMNDAGLITHPGLDGTNTMTWINGGNIPDTDYGTQFVVQTSADLMDWTPVPNDGSDTNLSNTAGSVSYTLPPAVGGKLFVRLVVTPN